ncbi:MAG TPA: serine/threonine-protein kinase [Polyangiaceae bacterium]|nr:serine/threonine-protein kinase [Polyangiaceae bacterium]
MSEWVTGQMPIYPLPGGTVHSPRGASYLLGELMGEGSFGAVFDCIGPFDQPFALKMFRPGKRHYSEVRAEWQREAERLYRLRHPNVVYVFDYFESQGLFYLVLERCDHSLLDMLGTPFTDRLVVDLSRQILFALQYLSDSQIIHNDLHAGNILVLQGEELTLKLSDLGIAQDLAGQTAVRPPLVQHRIMAPELVAGGYTTKQSDLYQLGLLMYEMHTGQYPVDTNQGYGAMLQQIKEGVPRLKAEALGTPIGNIVSVLLRRNEQYRYTSPAQVWEELRRLDVWADVVRQTETLVPPPTTAAESPKA